MIVIDAKPTGQGDWQRLNSLPEINERLTGNKIDRDKALELAGLEVGRWRATVTDAFPEISLRVTDTEASTRLLEAA